MIRRILIILLLSLSAWAQGGMGPGPGVKGYAGGGGGITFDAAANATPTVGTTSISWSHTIGATAHPVLVAAIGMPGFTTFGTATCSWNTSETMTQLAGMQDGAGATSTALFILKAPSTGTHTISCTSLTTADWVAGSASFFGVDQTTPNRSAFTQRDTSGPAASPTSITVTNAVSGDMVVDTTIANVTPITIGGGQTSIYHVDNPSGDGIAYGVSYKAATGSTAMTWSYSGTSFWASVAVALVPG